MARQGKPIHTAKPRRGRGFGRLLFIICVLLLLWAAAYAAGGYFGAIHPPAAPAEPRYTGTAPFTVAIDAGHGGRDNGAVGFVVEKEMTTATAQALVALLEADPNFIPVTTRQSYEDTAEPADRAAQANRQQAQLLLSIHGNAAATAEPAGFECYPVPPGRTRHEASRYFARQLAAEMSAAGQTLRGDEGVRYAYYGMNNEKTIVDGSTKMPSLLPTFGILEHADCPAVLVEQCFVTSEADAAAFGSGEGIQVAARCYYRAICAYFDLQPMDE
ncbi:MAG: N-acetylmuramoyl-L-alanine amidase [Faecalibacterium sp.]|nr:N-acetylmuramoyl-L-alanine amidase [Faecalibacterium sp.]